MRRILCRPGFWLLAFFGWFAVLWVLSSLSFNNLDIPAPKFPHDKLEHFSYFACGGFFLGSCWLSASRSAPAWKRVFLIVVLTIGAIGIVDEWHQCFTPGRNGGDPWDWLADLLGGAMGVWILRPFHRWLR